MAKDLEVQQRKMKKYQRDIANQKSDQVFKWQSKIEGPQPASTYLTPEREVRIQQEPNTPYPLSQQGRDNRGTYPETPRPQYEHRGNGNYWHQTSRNTWKKPFKKPFKKPYYNWHNNERNQRDNRGPPYQQDYYGRPERSPISTYIRFDPIRNQTMSQYQHTYYEQEHQRSFLDRERRDHSPRRRSVGEGVFNLSGKEITTEELAMLDKGLKHAPIKNLNKFDTTLVFGNM